MEPPWAEPQSWVLIRPVDVRQLPGLCASSTLVAAGVSHWGQRSGEQAEQGSRLAAGRIQALTARSPRTCRTGPGAGDPPALSAALWPLPSGRPGRYLGPGEDDGFLQVLQHEGEHGGGEGHGVGAVDDHKAIILPVVALQGRRPAQAAQLLGAGTGAPHTQLVELGDAWAGLGHCQPGRPSGYGAPVPMLCSLPGQPPPLRPWGLPVTPRGPERTWRGSPGTLVPGWEDSPRNARPGLLSTPSAGRRRGPSSVLRRALAE